MTNPVMQLQLFHMPVYKYGSQSTCRCAELPCATKVTKVKVWFHLTKSQFALGSS